ncbi:MAG: hypothetical protein JNK20_13605 [Flavipsychrobacter sp.]|nr:hypothetical protein [Flavipsychrobacter sp.]
MAKLTKLEEGVTYQAVCTKGDFFGKHHSNSNDAEADAANHTSKPGKTNHVVKIITTIQQVRAFSKNE